jgi:hypothetical protein
MKQRKLHITGLYMLRRHCLHFDFCASYDCYDWSCLAVRSPIIRCKHLRLVDVKD